MGGKSLKQFKDSLQFWTKDNALEIDVIEEPAEVLTFNVIRCRYADLYESLGVREIGTIFPAHAISLWSKALIRISPWSEPARL